MTVGGTVTEELEELVELVLVGSIVEDGVIFVVDDGATESK